MSDRIKNFSYADVCQEIYLTWHAAHEDIAAHRSRNHHVEKFLVLCKLKKMKKVDEYGEPYGDYDYCVLASRKFTQKQIHRIETNADEIVAKIRAKRKPSLELFYLS